MNVRGKYFATRYEIQNNGLNYFNMNLKTDYRNIVERKKYLILYLLILNTYYLIYIYKTLIRKI